MNNTEDIRWIQRFDSFTKAFVLLENAILLSKERTLSELERQGLIQSFEFTHELAWKTIKDFFEWQGTQDVFGSKDAAREAFSFGLIDDGSVWMKMIKSRNESSHTYNEKTAEEIFIAVTGEYYKAFKDFSEKMTSLKSRGK